MVYCGPRCDISVRAHCGDYFEDISDTRCVDLFAFHLRDCSVHPVSGTGIIRIVGMSKQVTVMIGYLGIVKMPRVVLDQN